MLHMAVAEVIDLRVDAEGQAIARLGGDDDLAWMGQRGQARGQIDADAVNIHRVDRHIVDMGANAQVCRLA